LEFLGLLDLSGVDIESTGGFGVSRFYFTQKFIGVLAGILNQNSSELLETLSVLGERVLVQTSQ
jgi:hypothetical protein